ncbi:50S ribosomal protein L30 [Desulfobacca acetoxidans]|uniref:50S ribosomal protein L30 n=1 Tax=Desulfobacca acetoxidans (strain ATCC 700848 / DSM 11109 / ASRB2) TaxID=880072 RepID=F2NJC1_DESAR|nr:50S ribosomal protein L30 [Desulfobacca acetoxidans]AEB09293.1 ribosomal protein L30 [Desulfobacca acetoxidans DSM 11109]HAY22504.1 50S ribosomal protein L30 [Desulfobacterales bacterium]
MVEQVLEITLKRSPIGRPERQRITLTTLGLTKLSKTVRHKDTPAVRGMVRQVAHLVEVRTRSREG